MKSILLIEDNREMRENTSEILGLAGYNVHTAENGKKGVEIAKANPLDLIICDIMMPELDGYGVLHLLGKDEKLATIPFIFLTAKAEKSDYRRGMGMGADDYITKPFDDIELLTAIETRLRKSELLKKDYSENQSEEFLEDANTIGIIDFDIKNKQTRHFRKKENIYMEGDAPKGVYYIRSGKVKTYKTNELGKELICDMLKEGDFMGHISVMQTIAYLESAEATEDTELMLIPEEDFNRLVFNHRGIAEKFMRMLAGNLKDKEERLIRLAYDSVRKRVATTLVELHEKNNQAIPAVLKVSREDLGNMVGTATESAIRTLSDFREEGLVDVRNNQIEILNIEQLRKMKN